MLLSATRLHITNLHFSAATSSSVKPPLLLTTNSSTSSSSLTTKNNTSSLLHRVTRTLPNGEPELSSPPEMLSSASAVASAIRNTSNSPIEFVQKMEKSDKSKLVLPSLDFRRLCIEQLDLFRRIVDPDAILSVYVRPAGSYVMDRLELRRVTSYPGIISASDVVILVGTFNIPTGLRAAEAALASQQVNFVPDHRAVVFPMVKHPFVVGFLVAELPTMELVPSYENVQTKGHENDLVPFQSPEEAYPLPSSPDNNKSWTIQTLNDESFRMYNFSAEQRLNAINISRSLAMAYVMDQKAMLLQQSSWQNNVRMSNLVEQIRGPLSSIQTLSKMLSTHLKRSEISYDIVEDIMVQGDRLRDTLQELQDAVHLTKANIMRYNEEALQRIHNSNYHHHESLGSHLSDNIPRDADDSNNLHNSGKPHSLNVPLDDLEMPMPPMALAPLQQYGIRPCNVYEVLSDLVGAVQPLTFKQQRNIVLSELSQSLQVAIEEQALRQALSNLIEGALLRTRVGGKVEIVCTEAPAGGALVIIDDDGPDMHYMTQMHSLAPFGAELLSENMIEDNMTWNFVAGLTVAREILESYGCVVRIISPRITDAALGTGGTQIELWLPSFAALSDLNDIVHET
ncbi:chloroplast sensor kinase, chloroplastic [Ricinus communis]|nr:chloroplast sensor kinase, chloroplastic [Ricinus communis]|eukprot:XP_015581406.1 chloroplast sensor kinase, chloroplastic [Ricinus communis]